MRPPLYSGHFKMSQSVLPLKCGHPSNQDTLTGPKGGRIRGSPLYLLTILYYCIWSYHHTRSYATTSSYCGTGMLQNNTTTINKRKYIGACLDYSYPHLSRSELMYVSSGLDWEGGINLYACCPTCYSSTSKSSYDRKEAVWEKTNLREGRILIPPRNITRRNVLTKWKKVQATPDRPKHAIKQQMVLLCSALFQTH